MMGSAGMGWMWIWPVLILAGLVLIIWVAVRLRRESRPGAAQEVSMDGPATARRILDERLARGEMSVEEYQRRRELLR